MLGHSILRFERFIGRASHGTDITLPFKWNCVGGLTINSDRDLRLRVRGGEKKEG